MHYTTVRVIYGIPLTVFSLKTNLTKKEEGLIWEAATNDFDGFITYFDEESIEQPRAFGIEIDSIRGKYQCSYINDVKFFPSLDQVKLYGELFDQLKPNLKKTLNKISLAPQLFFLWTTEER